jgi:hypothetical protein
MQQNQKLGTQPNAQCQTGRPVPSGFQKNISGRLEPFRDLPAGWLNRAES